MSANVVAVGKGYPFSTSGNVVGHGVDMLGIFVSAATTTPTITVYDDSGTGTTTKVVDTFTPVAGTWYPMPLTMKNGINIVITGTVSATVSAV